MRLRYVRHLSYFAGGWLLVEKWYPQWWARGTWWATREEAKG